MRHSLALTVDMYDKLRAHLLQSSEEQVAFIFAETIDSGDGVIFLARDVYLVVRDELLVQEHYHVSLTDDAQAKIIKMAWDRRLALVEVHSHPRVDGGAQFSPSDLWGFDEFVPHVRWRLRGSPYLAVVVGPSDFDALVWRDHSPEPLASIQVDDSVFEPTGMTLQALRSASDGS
jgi:hypothetical protein